MPQSLQFLLGSLRGRLACLVLAVTIPASVLVVWLVLESYRNEKEAVSQHLLATTRAVAGVVDRQIGENAALLRGLVSAGALSRGDLAAFEDRLRSMDLGRDQWLVLTDATGQQLINTRVARGTQLPRQDFDGEFKEAIASGRTYVSNLLTGTLNNQPMMFVAVPIQQNGTLKYTLSYVMFTSALGDALSVDQLSPGTVIAILDREGTIAARHPNGERFAGKKAMPDIVDATRNWSEGVHDSVTLEGNQVLATHSRAAWSGWSVAMGAPTAALYASAQKLLWTGVVISALLLSLAVGIAIWIGRAVVRSVDGLVADTDVVGHGAVPPVRSGGLAETDFVAAAVRNTAQRLAERERDNAQLTATLQAELEKQKRAEQATRRLAAIVESSDDAIIAKTLDGIVTSWNKSAERIFGYTAEEMIGQPMALVIPHDRQAEEPAILETIRGGKHIEPFETLRRRKDGALIPIALTISPVRGDDGAVVGASTIARDISQRKWAEAQQQALYDLVARVNRAAALPEIYEAAVEAMLRCQDADRAAILLCDADGEMRFKASRGLSPQYCRAVEGHSPWRATDGHPAPLWIDDVARATLSPNIREAVEAEGIRALAFVPLSYNNQLLGKFMLYYDAPHHFSAAELKPVETIASQVGFAIERQRGADALEKLVDERTASLRQAVAQMEEFSYSVSHDLRAPARAMRGYAEAILQDHAAQLDETGRELLQRIQRNSGRMDRLIQDLLTYSRISRREIQLEPVSLDKLVREVLQQYPDMRPERADIVVEGPLPDVLAHEPSLTQVVSNLLSNAVKFVAPNARPRVRVGFERKASQARLWFQDNGIGIKPEVQARLFRMFERVHPDKHYEGTGIGLAIVRKAVERMNGAVGVESDGVSGSRFWFELPMACEPVRDEAADVAPLTPAGVRGTS